MLKPSDLTKAELLQVVEMLAEAANEYYLDRALGRIEMQRNDAHFERCRKLIDEEQKHYAAYFDLLRPYEGKPIVDVPQDVLEQAQAEFDKARAAGQEWNRRNGIKLKGKICGSRIKIDRHRKTSVRIIIEWYENEISHGLMYFQIHGNT